MKILLSIAVLSIAFAPFQTEALASAQHAPVVVELFTSEGCSDCPPADDLLTAIAQRPPDNVQVIPLEFHVTYWDRYGWRDRFSDDRYTQRQVDYVHHFVRVASPYTPQTVIDGRYQTVGNDQASVGALIRQAETDADPVNVELSVAGRDVTVTAHSPDEKISGTVLLLITEDGLSTDVKAGENRSRTLHHSAVVRSLEPIGTFKHGTFSRGVRLKLARDWQRNALHAVVLVQDSDDHVLGAATAPIPTDEGRAAK